MSSAIQLSGITKRFGDKVAVRDFDLAVPRGALYGFIGPNGAGKTTTIRIILSILFPDSGEVSVLGHRSALEAKDRIGYLPEERGLYRKMKAARFLGYMARLKGQSGPEVARRVDSWLERVGLAEAAGKRCEELSKGMQQKLQFLAAIVHEPELLVLDEPFSGLDPVNARLLRDLVLEQHRRGATVIFSTHVMTQAEQLCERVVMIDGGRKVLDDTLPGIRQRYTPRAIRFEAADPAASLEPLRSVPGVKGLSRADGAWQLEVHDGHAPSAVLAAAVAAVPAARAELVRPTLEDVFVRIVTGEDAERPEHAELRASLREGVETP
jgi:ABC-2 type transport system ATP-binding protein